MQHCRASYEPIVKTKVRNIYYYCTCTYIYYIIAPFLDRSFAHVCTCVILVTFFRVGFDGSEKSLGKNEFVFNLFIFIHLNLFSLIVISLSRQRYKLNTHCTFFAAYSSGHILLDRSFF